MSKQLTYLACPYSHPDPVVREQRFRLVNLAAATLMRDGKFIYSPISHTHPITMAGDLPGDWYYWSTYDRAFLEASKEMMVLTLDGWKESVGVNAEIKIAEELGIPISYIQTTAIHSGGHGS